jgi:hypothetical protein
MKSLFPTSNKNVETIRLDNDTKCDVYVWNSPEGVKIATHMIMPCPSCNYPLSLATSEFDFDVKTLKHELKCPARWKKTTTTTIGERSLILAELNEKGKPVIQRCGWKGYIVDGELISDD